MQGGQIQPKDVNESTILWGISRDHFVIQMRAVATGLEFADAIAFAKAKTTLTGFETYSHIS